MRLVDGFSSATLDHYPLPSNPPTFCPPPIFTFLIGLCASPFPSVSHHSSLSLPLLADEDNTLLPPWTLAKEARDARVSAGETGGVAFAAFAGQCELLASQIL